MSTIPGACKPTLLDCRVCLPVRSLCCCEKSKIHFACSLFFLVLFGFSGDRSSPYCMFTLPRSLLFLNIYSINRAGSNTILYNRCRQHRTLSLLDIPDVVIKLSLCDFGKSVNISHPLVSYRQKRSNNTCLFNSKL